MDLPGYCWADDIARFSCRSRSIPLHESERPFHLRALARASEVAASIYEGSKRERDLAAARILRGLVLALATRGHGDRLDAMAGQARLLLQEHPWADESVISPGPEPHDPLDTSFPGYCRQPFREWYHVPARDLLVADAVALKSKLLEAAKTWPTAQRDRPRVIGHETLPEYLGRKAIEAFGYLMREGSVRHAFALHFDPHPPADTPSRPDSYRELVSVFATIYGSAGEAKWCDDETAEEIVKAYLRSEGVPESKVANAFSYIDHREKRKATNKAKKTASKAKKQRKARGS